MHVYRNTEHRCQRDEIAANMSVGDGSVVGSPVVHHRIDIDEWSMTCDVGYEPGGGPSGIGAGIQRIVNRFRQIDQRIPPLSGGLVQGRCTRLRRHIVTGISPRVVKSVDQPPPGKYSVTEGHHFVAARQAFASSPVMSHHCLRTGMPLRDLLAGPIQSRRP